MQTKVQYRHSTDFLLFLIWLCGLVTNQVTTDPRYFSFWMRYKKQLWILSRWNQHNMLSKIPYLNWMRLRCNERSSAFLMGVEGTVSLMQVGTLNTPQMSKQTNAISTVTKQNGGLQVVRIDTLCNLSGTVIEGVSPEALRTVWTGTKPHRHISRLNKSHSPLNLSWHQWLIEIAEKQEGQRCLARR